MNDKKADPDKRSAIPIAAPGYYFILAAGFATVVFAFVGTIILASVCFAVTLFICWFFRDPERVVPMDQGAVVSPADGKVIIVERLKENPFTKEDCIKISIFMNVFNVHVNRIPHEGKVTNISYFPGKFFNASFDKASKENERNAVLIETASGKKICAVQIAGLIARRIICRLKHGDVVKRGERFGMICFGSRLDVYMPADSKISVAVGNKIKAGSGILGYLA
ncbi:MAG: phosphatidylserine decarboxylase family protein [Pseudomonadota bacterium]